MRDLIRKLLQSEAIIFAGEYKQSYVAYARGDRRRRPVCWLSEVQFKHLQAQGIVEPREAGFALAYSFIRRQKQATSAQPHAYQHRDLKAREVYIFEGVKRPAVFNEHQKPLRRLSRYKVRGKPLLTTAQIEAGERFAKDYYLSALDRMVTQNYVPLNPVQSRNSHAMNATESQIEARKRIRNALEHMGPGLCQAVLAVCVQELNLERLEWAENWLKGSGQTLLKLGLQRLVSFYGTLPGEQAFSAAATSV